MTTQPNTDEPYSPSILDQTWFTNTLSKLGVDDYHAIELFEAHKAIVNREVKNALIDELLVLADSTRLAHHSQVYVNKRLATLQGRGKAI